MASTAAEISTNNHSGSSRTPRVRVVKGGRYGLSKARQFARTAGTVLVIAIFFGLFASIVASQARITQLSGEIDDAKSELTNAQSYNDYLSTTHGSDHQQHQRPSRKRRIGWGWLKWTPAR